MFIKTVVEALNRAPIRYVLVGGYAVALHGAVRGTVDLDFVIALESEQFEAVEKVMASIGLMPRLPVCAHEVFEFRQEYIDKRNLVAWSFTNHDNPLEMVDIIITHDANMMDTETVSADGLTISVATIDELINMKRSSGRPQDLEDIRALERLK